MCLSSTAFGFLYSYLVTGDGVYPFSTVLLDRVQSLDEGDGESLVLFETDLFVLRPLGSRVEIDSTYRGWSQMGTVSTP